MQRRYDIDWLRNMGIMLLFPFHTARIFDVWDPFYVKNDVESWGLSWFIAVTSYWFMPLLFWLAGAACWYALQRRTDRQFIQERVSRLLIPLLAGTLLIVPPQGYYALKMQTGEAGNYGVFLLDYFVDFSDLSGYFGSFTPAHLWFILYLLMFSLIALPLFRRLVSHQKSANVKAVLRKCSHPVLFLSFVIPLTALQALPAPGGQNPFYYFFIFAAGFLVCTHPQFDVLFARYRFPALLTLFVTVPVWLWMMYHYRGAADFSAVHILMTLLRTLNVWLTLIAIIGYGSKLLNFSHRWLGYANEAAFPIYVIHQTVIVIIGYYIVQFDLNLYVKFALILPLSFLASWLLYDQVIRRFAVTRWLFGLKKR